MCLLKVCPYPVDNGRFKVKSGLFTLNMGVPGCIMGLARWREGGQ